MYRCLCNICGKVIEEDKFDITYCLFCGRCSECGHKIIFNSEDCTNE